MKLSEAIEKFKAWRTFKVRSNTVRGYDLTLRSFCIFMHNCDLEAVGLDNVIEWFSLQQTLNYDQNSFIGKATALRKFFEFFQKQGFKVLDPFLIPVPSKTYKIPRVANDEAYAKLLASIPHPSRDPRHIRNRAIIMLLWDTGARNGEICALNTTDLDFERMRAVIMTEKSKGRRPIREIFWTTDTNEQLKLWVKKRAHLATLKDTVDKEALFIGSVGVKMGDRFTNRGIGEMLRRYCDKADMPGMNAHSFRHHMGHDIVHQGGSAVDVMNILGHATLASSSIYTMMNNTELEERYTKLKRKSQI